MIDAVVNLMVDLMADLITEFFGFVGFTGFAGFKVAVVEVVPFPVSVLNGFLSVSVSDLSLGLGLGLSSLVCQDSPGVVGQVVGWVVGREAE